MSDENKIPYEEYGHEIAHGEWLQLMIHFYRGEMNRATIWRQRLDVTTNWAVAAIAAMLTIILGNTNIPHTAVALTVGLTFIMLHMEARRYLYYDIWRSRLRMIERGVIAPALWRESAQRELEHEGDWRRMLADDLRVAHFHMPYAEAFGRRLQRNYIWLLLLNYGAWVLKLSICPGPVTCPADLAAHAAIGSLPGSFVFLMVTLLIVLCAVLGRILTRHRHARGEAQPYRPSQDQDRWGIV